LPPDASKAFGVESGRFHAESDQTFTVLERSAFFAKFLVDGGSGAIMLVPQNRCGFFLRQETFCSRL
jgi:hypothetical protein